METLYADFNNRDEHDRIRLNSKGSLEDIERVGRSVRSGQEVWLADEEGRVRATLEFVHPIWVGVAAWDSWEEIPYKPQERLPVVPFGR